MLQRFFVACCGCLFLLAGLASCTKDRILRTGGELRFSADTLTFDTVFTAAGSFTVGLKLFNPQNSPVTVSSVRLERGSASQFRINVDGRPGPVVQGIDIAANDSVYVFATVRVNPDTADAPFIVEDRLVATLNGQDFFVPLLAYGQNAHYITGEALDTQTWGATDKKPYVIIHSAVVKDGATLTLAPGTRVYMHADSRLLVRGTLQALGTKTDSIIFQGDRLDRGYFGGAGYPGEWGGLYFFSRSTGNVLRHTILKNGGNTALGALPALVQVDVDSVADGIPQLYLDRVTIENSIGYGLVTFGGSIRGDNVLIHSCGAQALAVLEGGNDTFNHCTFVIQNPPRVSHTDQPTVALLNYFESSPGVYQERPLTALLRNCIVWGSLQDEIICYKRSLGYNVLLQNCLLKTATADATAAAQRQANLPDNTDPGFVDASKQNFHLKAGSPCKNAGTPVADAALSLDRDDVPRSGQWDPGCYRVP